MVTFITWTIRLNIILEKLTFSAKDYIISREHFLFYEKDVLPCVVAVVGFSLGPCVCKSDALSVSHITREMTSHAQHFHYPLFFRLDDGI